MSWHAVVDGGDADDDIQFGCGLKCCWDFCAAFIAALAVFLCCI